MEYYLRESNGVYGSLLDAEGFYWIRDGLHTLVPFQVTG